MMAASAPIGSLTPWKQNNESDIYQVYKQRSSPKPRPMSSSPRYVRTWSQDEEAYLLEARRARVPYKDIAARLNKSDLACRLHYHQMVVARKNSVSEETSIPTPPAEQYASAMQYHHHRSGSLSPITTAMSPQMLLPAPMMRETSRTGSGAATLNPQHRRSTSYASTPSKRQPMPSPPLGGVSKQSPTPQSARRLQHNGSVDLGRIQELYRDFAPTFWSNIAAAYSHDKSVSPSDVESAFFHGHGLGLTHDQFSPNGSVEASPANSWPSALSTVSSATSQITLDDQPYAISEHHSEKTSNTKCSVNSLLNN